MSTFPVPATFGRRWLIGAAAVLIASGAVGAPPLKSTQVVGVAKSVASDHAAVESVVAVGMTVADLDRAVAFYTGVLSFELTGEGEHHGPGLERLTGVFGARARTARLRLGDERIELTEFLAPEGRPMPTDSRSNDRWFQHIAVVVSDIDRAYAHLRAHKARHASPGPQTLPAWNPGAGGISAFYFKDPDGHVLEVIHFPAGKGDPRWQRGGADRLFLGIDHTAIVVADTDRSVAFYRDVLGMRVAGESENFGPEQERLNNVFGARLRITGMRAASGPGVEFLEYLAPTNGRDYPRDARENDVMHWHTVLAAADADALAARLRAARASMVTPGIERGAEAFAGLAEAFDVRDPDGHVLRIGRGTVSSASPGGEAGGR